MFPPPPDDKAPPAIVFEPVRAATAHEVSIPPSSARVRPLLPDAFDYSHGAEADFTLLPRARSGVNALEPSTGVFTEGVSVRSEQRVAVKRPKAHAVSALRRAISQSRAGVHVPHAGSETPATRLSASAHYAYWTPETVQNLPEELIMFL